MAGPPMEWLDISTAPIDGREILIGVFGEDGAWIIDIVRATEFEFCGDDWGFSRNLCTHTHWHDIDAPPFPVSF